MLEFYNVAAIPSLVKSETESHFEFKIKAKIFETSTMLALPEQKIDSKIAPACSELVVKAIMATVFQTKSGTVVIAVRPPIRSGEAKFDRVVLHCPAVEVLPVVEWIGRRRGKRTTYFRWHDDLPSPLVLTAGFSPARPSPPMLSVKGEDIRPPEGGFILARSEDGREIFRGLLYPTIYYDPDELRELWKRQLTDSARLAFFKTPEGADLVMLESPKMFLTDFTSENRRIEALTAFPREMTEEEFLEAVPLFKRHCYRMRAFDAAEMYPRVIEKFLALFDESSRIAVLEYLSESHKNDQHQPERGQVLDILCGFAEERLSEAFEIILRAGWPLPSDEQFRQKFGDADIEKMRAMTAQKLP